MASVGSPHLLLINQSEIITSVNVIDDNDLPQDDLEDVGALDLDYMDTEFKMPQSLKKDLQDETKDTREGLSTDNGTTDSKAIEETVSDIIQ